MPDLASFVLGAPSNLVQFSCLEITHSDFSTSSGAEDDPRPSGQSAYRLVRNAHEGISVTHEGPAGPFEYRYVPFSFKPLSAQDDLVQALQVTLGDVGDVIAKEIGVIAEANGLDERPQLIFRTYREDDLTEPMQGPVTLEIRNVTTEKDGATFEAHAPELNASRTGQLYTLTRFPMLRGFF